MCLGDPLAVDAPAWLGSPASPEEDLTAALADLKAAPDANAAAKARGRALAIIEGDTRSAVAGGRLVAGDEGFLARKAYAGIPLLNASATTDTTVKTVPAPTTAKPVPTVDVREVRYGDHAILDTSLLRFADMNAAVRHQLARHRARHDVWRRAVAHAGEGHRRPGYRVAAARPPRAWTWARS